MRLSDVGLCSLAVGYKLYVIYQSKGSQLAFWLYRKNCRFICRQFHYHYVQVVSSHLIICLEFVMNYIKYNYMSKEVEDFCGKENITSEANQASGCIGYFLTDNNISERYMFCSGMYIVKSADGNISLTYRKPN